MRRLMWALPVLLLSSPVAAQETDVRALQLKACTLIEEDAPRVRCYDHAMSRPPSQSNLVPLSSGSGALVAVPNVPTVAPTAKATHVPQAPAVSPSQNKPVAAAPQPMQAPQSPGLDVFGLSSTISSITPSITLPKLSTNEKQPAWDVKADNVDLQKASRVVGSIDAQSGRATLALECRNGSPRAMFSTHVFLGWEDVPAQYRLNNGPIVEGRWQVLSDGRTVAVADARRFIESLSDGNSLDVRLKDYSGTEHDFAFSITGASGIKSQLDAVCRRG